MVESDVPIPLADVRLLLEANQRLALALLRAQADAKSLADEDRLQSDGRRLASLASGSPTLERAAPVLPDERPIQPIPLEQLQAHLQQSNQSLLLAALNAQDLHTAAERAHRRLTDFLGTLAHELRNPLSAIGGAVALMDRIPAAELPAMQRLVARQVTQIGRLVNDLLDLSRANRGKLRLDSKDIAVGESIAAAIEACRPLVDARQQNLLIELSPVPARMVGDAGRLTQVISNLLDNASKYTPRGGEVRLTTWVDADQLRLTVSDNGIGISEAALSDIFLPFVQDSRAVAFSGGGLGIGLSVVRELVEAHGGKVTASSAGIGRGAQFTVALPLLPA